MSFTPSSIFRPSGALIRPLKTGSFATPFPHRVIKRGPVLPKTASSAFYSTKTPPQNVTEASAPFPHDSIYVISVPITTHKSYIHCHHKPAILHPLQLQTFPLMTKLESKATGLVVKGWDKLRNSNNAVSKWTHQLAVRLLNAIPYEEACLRLFPSKNSMIREVNEEHLTATKLDVSETATMVQSRISNLEIPADQLKKIPIYHPSFQDPRSILSQLERFRDESYLSHVKYAAICAVGVPITMPFALVPVVPNIPGFYLAYRFYCNMKLLLGAKHLAYLLERDVSGNDTTHMAFSELPSLDSVYGEAVPEGLEKLILTEEGISKIVGLGFAHLEDDLKKALRQEAKRLKKE